MKARHFRGVKVKLECGCTAVLSSSFYRLSKARAALIVGHYVRSGCWCWNCKATCVVTKHLGTTRL